MAVRIRLARHGRKKRPFYRIVAADGRAPRDGRYIERLGHFDPMSEPNELVVDLERVDYWIGVGASPSETAAKLIEKARRRRGLNMEGLVDFMVRSVVKNPDAVKLDVTEGDASVFYELDVADEDRDLITGGETSLLDAMRQILAASSGKRRGVIELAGESDAAEE